ncbi:MAG: baseplate J/gp47 family protein [Bacteroidia bacterium]|nr:baseplate J/gp47 family protein [Bacteroidia bacterium]
MTFTPRKYKDIFDEMRAMSQVVTDFEVGSVARTMYESFAYEMALLYEKMQLVYLSGYVDTARGNQLDQVVAVLGIQRSLPDYAEGTVTFLREGAGQEIIIPQGTLIATEESSTGEKKVFQTSKVATMGATQTTVEVQIRAIERGEEQETASETIVVMPRPVPGIKYVNNESPVRLVGKRRETDEELRERAKNALISSGKATILSIENALLSLSGVRDARVKENFHFPRGLLHIKNLGQLAMDIPRGSLLSITPAGSPETFFKTLDPVSYDGTELVGTKKEVKVEALIEGKSGELTDLGNPYLDWKKPEIAAAFTGKLATDIRLEDFGLIEVYVDAPRLEEGTEAEKQAEKKRIETEIERVRAAGIFSILKPAGKVVTSAVFRIDVSASLSLNMEERGEFEQKVADEIIGFMGDLRMGKALLYGKLVKAILDLENIENLADFEGTVTRKVLNEDLSVFFNFSGQEKFISVEEFERIKPRHISVASEDKELEFNIAYQALNLNGTDAGLVAAALQGFFGQKVQGETVLQSEIEQNIVDSLTNQGLILTPNSLSLTLKTWSPGPEDDPRELLIEKNGDFEAVVTFVEKPVVKTIFGYANRLEITGAIKLILPLNILDKDRDKAIEGVEIAVSKVLDQLGPEEDITFEALTEAAKAVPQVLDASIEKDDFLGFINGLVQPNIVDKKKIAVGLLNRAFFEFLCISDTIEPVSISTNNLTLTLANPAAATQSDRDALKLAVRNAFNNALADSEPGESVVFSNLKGKLENPIVPTVNFSVASLDLQADSEADNRVQTASIGAPNDLHIRSVEQAFIVPIQTGDIQFTN